MATTKGNTMVQSSRGLSQWLTIVATVLVLAGLVFISMNLAQNVGQHSNGAAPIPADNEAALTQEMLRISDDLQCPICEGQSVAYSNSRLATEMREQTSRLLREGATEAEIKQYFVDRYGVIVLREPPRTGLNLLLWQMPFIAVGLGVVILGWTMLQTSRNRKSTASVPSETANAGTIDSASPSTSAESAIDPEINELLAQYDDKLFGRDGAKS